MHGSMRRTRPVNTPAGSRANTEQLTILHPAPMMKVSFDFDDTLDRADVQAYAEELIARGVEVWVCTARVGDWELKSRYNANADLYEVVDRLGIPRERIIFERIEKASRFTCGTFAWHLDDDPDELRALNRKTKTVGVSSWHSGTWRSKCERILKHREKQWKTDQEKTLPSATLRELESKTQDQEKS